MSTTPSGRAQDTVEAAAGSVAIIRAVGVSKTYRTGTVEVPALRDIHLEVPRGALLAVMGPSGCGKTTLLNCLSGLDTVDSGQVFIEGQDIARLSDNARTDYRARKMGFIFQFYNLLPVLSAVENVELPMLVSGTRPSEARAAAMRALERVGLVGRADHRPAQLSGGERQRVTIARALANEPAIVWGDEPTGDLDSATADSVMLLIEELNRERQQTFILVTHDANIGRRCQRTIQMRDGQIIAEVDN